MKRKVKFHLRTLIAAANEERADGAPKITYQVISDATGMSISTLSKLANNGIARVNLNVLERICDFFECGIADLITLDPDPGPG